LCQTPNHLGRRSPRRAPLQQRKIAAGVYQFNVRSLVMVHFVLAQAQSPAPGVPGGGIGFFVPFIFIFIIMYFVMIRPQKRRQEQQQKLIASLKTGDRVVTNAGIHGLISNVKDTTVIVKVADNVKIEMEKSAITNVMKTETAKQ
jgi:preprotein translocase subunit YajC